jgi:hypothetical protein
VAGPTYCWRVPVCAVYVTCTTHRSYGASICVCSIIISTEPELVIGIGWTLAICLLGCPNACVWAAVQLYQRGSLRLASGPDEASGKDGLTGTDVARSTGSMLGIAWFLVYAVFFIIMLVVTMYKRNLFDLDFGDLSWCIWWLMTTCFDYYGCCTVLVACMLSTEEELQCVISPLCSVSVLHAGIQRATNMLMPGGLQWQAGLELSRAVLGHSRIVPVDHPPRLQGGYAELG